VLCLVQCAEAQHAVPETVSDQLRFWELESLRIRAEPAVAYHDFATAAAFTAAVAAAEGMVGRTVRGGEGGTGGLYVGRSEGLLVAPAAAHAELAAAIRQ
jgi:hypothetical protein